MVGLCVCYNIINNYRCTVLLKLVHTGSIAGGIEEATYLRLDKRKNSRALHGCVR